MVFLILLIIATAVLSAWLLMALGRLAFGDLHLPRLHPSPAAAPELTAAAPVVPDPPASASEPEKNVLYDESDAEQVVRGRLYGHRGRRRT